MLAGGLILFWIAGSVAFGLFLGAIARRLKHKAGSATPDAPAVCPPSTGSRDPGQVAADQSLSHGACE